MSLTKEDLGQIKQVVTEVVAPRFDKVDQRLTKVEADIEHLAVSTKRQFDAMDMRFDGIDEELGAVKDVIAGQEFRLTKAERKLKSS